MVLNADLKPCHLLPPSQLQRKKESNIPGPGAYPAPCRSCLFTFCFVNYVSDSQRPPKLIGSISVTSLPPLIQKWKLPSTTYGFHQLTEEILEIRMPIRVGSLNCVIYQLNNRHKSGSRATNLLVRCWLISRPSTIWG